MQRLLQPYLIAVERYPFVTKCLTSGVLVGSGDVISQTIIEKAKNPEKKVRARYWNFFVTISLLL